MSLEDKIRQRNIAVIIPAYNVGTHIVSVIRAAPNFVKYIIVVDDCSTDDTAEKVSSLSDERIILIRHKKNQGVGGAMVSGYRKAIELDVDVAVKVDGDGQMDPQLIPQFVLPILAGEADYTKGNRFYFGETIGKMPFIRRIGNVVLSFLTKAASGYWNIFDPTNGYTAINARLLPFVRFNHVHPRYFFESSFLVELNLIRAKIKDVPIHAKYADETSHLSVFHSFFEFPFLLLKSFLKRIKYQYFIYDFNVFSLFFVVGLLLLGFGGIWGAFNWYLSISRNQVATTGTVMIAVLPIILGFQLLIQAIVLDIQNVPQKAVGEIRSD